MISVCPYETDLCKIKINKYISFERYVYSHIRYIAISVATAAETDVPEYPFYKYMLSSSTLLIRKNMPKIMFFNNNSLNKQMIAKSRRFTNCVNGA